MVSRGRVSGWGTPPTRPRIRHPLPLARHPPTHTSRLPLSCSLYLFPLSRLPPFYYLVHHHLPNHSRLVTSLHRPVLLFSPSSPVNHFLRLSPTASLPLTTHALPFWPSMPPLSLRLRTSTGEVTTRTLGTRTWPGAPAEDRVPEEIVPVPAQVRASACSSRKLLDPFVFYALASARPGAGQCLFVPTLRTCCICDRQPDFEATMQESTNPPSYQSPARLIRHPPTHITGLSPSPFPCPSSPLPPPSVLPPYPFPPS